jgi:hypothetical protein
MHACICVNVSIYTWIEREGASEGERETVTRHRHTHTCTYLKVERMKKLVRGAPVSTDRIRAYAYFGNDRACAKLAERTKFSNSV